MNTRFNPTVCGPLHIGHLYLILINEFHAHSTGGKFLIRADDNQIPWLDSVGAAKMAEYFEGVKADMDWMGIKVDGYTSQAELSQGARFQNRMRELGFGKMPAAFDRVPVCVGKSDPQYPYAPYLTAEKVIMDHMMGVDMLIRGVELLGEYSLYEFYCEWLNYPHIPHIYLPRLHGPGGELDVVSKTVGTHKIATFREQGYKPADIVTLLRYACLEYVHGDFDYHNVKAHPMLSTESPMFRYTRTATAEFVRG